ncbi:GNAT family N-acetyltransferase [Occallatibacter riparius]|uniref:GNAT family N-acetyltransferase n=1 Tax=Occallatibacter riparius TaxID=1002689 RepID=A0A9J7BI06_9BACT|nr:GNAT family N-acetyltransferase [Occallatibacter riparius]UWZ82432.1 GNAT family N-acetyltransferase [Occallatibacter riparius]
MRDDDPIRPAHGGDFESIWSVINDGAQAYRGSIPPDRLHDPYMSREELRIEIAAGVQFWIYEDSGGIAAVMGLQYVQDVTLIRHAYVLTERQRGGIGGRMLKRLSVLARGPVLIGTWADATWAIRFYERHGFRTVSHDEKERLLRKYWQIPERQVETSVVLTNRSQRF